MQTLLPPSPTDRIAFTAMLVALVGALASIISYRKTYVLSKQNAEGSTFMEAQKFLIEICKQLIEEPLLWCLYDGEAAHRDLREKFSEEAEEPKNRAKLLAFAHLHLNMFEIVLAEAPLEKGPVIFAKMKRFFTLKISPHPAEATGPFSLTKVWSDYLDFALGTSTLMREVLDEPESRRIWHPRLRTFYTTRKQKYQTRGREGIQPAPPKGS
jgi:hypothetical protein